MLRLCQNFKNLHVKDFFINIIARVRDLTIFTILRRKSCDRVNCYKINFGLIASTLLMFILSCQCRIIAPFNHSLRSLLPRRSLLHKSYVKEVYYAIQYYVKEVSFIWLLFKASTRF